MHKSWPKNYFRLLRNNSKFDVSGIVVIFSSKFTMFTEDGNDDSGHIGLYPANFIAVFGCIQMKLNVHYFHYEQVIKLRNAVVSLKKRMATEFTRSQSIDY